MRSDLIAAAMIHRWLSNNAPELIDGWDFDCTPDLNAFVDRVKTIVPQVDVQFAGQGAVARTAIEHWELNDVVLFGGGMPTPLTPAPEQIMYYTDNSAEVVSEAGQKGYNTRVVDVKNLEDLKSLPGGKTAISTGLFHFLDDASAKNMLAMLAEANFHTLVFNNLDHNVTDVMMSSWVKMGYSFVLRSPEHVPAILTSGWRIADSLTIPDFFQHNRQIGTKLIKDDNLFHIYRLVRD